MRRYLQVAICGILLDVATAGCSNLVKIPKYSYLELYPPKLWDWDDLPQVEPQLELKLKVEICIKDFEKTEADKETTITLTSILWDDKRQKYFFVFDLEGRSDDTIVYIYDYVVGRFIGKFYVPMA